MLVGGPRNWYFLCFKLGGTHACPDAGENDPVERTMVIQKQEVELLEQKS